MIRLLFAASLALCAASAAQATDWAGIWRADACDAGTESWVIGAGAEAMINDVDFTTAPVTISAAPTAGNWHSYRTSDGVMYYIAMTESEELVFLDLLEESVDRYGEGVDAGRITPETHRDIWDQTLHHRCDTLPAASRLLFGEMTSVMLSVDAALSGCSDSQPADHCVARIVDGLDLTGDGALNRAELSRAMRAATLFATGRSDDWTLNADGAIAQLTTAPLAPVLASLLLGSFDYSGDGALDAAEISADRFSLTPTRDLASTLPDGSTLNSVLEEQLSTLLPLLLDLAN